ncbi:MAG: hypothetical protein R3E65_01880 [Steroidobacteraceae bacterium]
MNRSRASLPAPLRASLLELFGDGVDDVRVIEHSWYARLHGRIVATTRRRHIYLRGSAAEFFEQPEIVLHEYFHVLKQWEPRRLSIWRYLLEWFRRGYWDNRFEIEAREFAADHLYRFRALLSRHQGGAPGAPGTGSAENALARVEPRRDPGQREA